MCFQKLSRASVRSSPSSSALRAASRRSRAGYMSWVSPRAAICSRVLAISFSRNRRAWPANSSGKLRAGLLAAVARRLFSSQNAPPATISSRRTASIRTAARSDALSTMVLFSGPGPESRRGHICSPGDGLFSANHSSLHPCPAPRERRHQHQGVEFRRRSD